jgi:ParB-like chromosome segregation protein Spo0J
MVRKLYLEVNAAALSERHVWVQIYAGVLSWGSLRRLRALAKQQAVEKAKEPTKTAKASMFNPTTDDEPEAKPTFA